MVDNYRVSAVISVYNEESTVESIVKTVLTCDLVDEVIAVNDGCKDMSKIKLEAFLTHNKFKYIEFEKNMGKSYAMMAGVDIANGEIIVFIDADLRGLHANHVSQIICSLVIKKADMIIGQPTENKLDEKLNPFQILSGERALFKKDIQPIIEDLRTVKYGIETLLNIYYKSRGLSIGFTYLWNVYHQIKPRKEGFNSFIKNYSIEAKDIIRTVVVHHLLFRSALKQLLRKRKR
jgi:Glycosyl transferase family 2